MCSTASMCSDMPSTNRTMDEAGALAGRPVRVNFVPTSAASTAAVRTVNDMTATGSTGITARATDDASINTDPGQLYRQSLDLATSNADSSGNHEAPLKMVGTGTDVTFGTATGPGTDGLTAASFAGGKALQATLGIAAPAAIWVECFFSTTGNSVYVVDSPGVGSNVHNVALFVLAGGTLRALLEAGAVNIILDSSGIVNDGETHHALLKSVNGGPTTLYVDGVSVDTDATAVTLDALASITVGAQALALGSGQFTGTVAHVALGTSDISATRIAAHAEAGLTGFAGDTAAERLARYAAYAGDRTDNRARD
jgi:hypothetical protein